jgi:hypothetical protein
MKGHYGWSNLSTQLWSVGIDVRLLEASHESQRDREARTERRALPRRSQKPTKRAVQRRTMKEATRRLNLSNGTLDRGICHQEISRGGLNDGTQSS